MKIQDLLVNMSQKPKPDILLLPKGRRLWFLRMETIRASCDQYWHRVIQ